ncbi:hypothetical protein [Paraliomyxa miuraensis]|uniref:hypothetical protein n=1 Tax=Paraliomyxa miuraensis TaxID=376150 RepID=UPI0022518C15|nr:hypothetical protein [Paraliomyxa miuraensis]MCX4239325.1 hypothetical protein [Paraliomyxa miuraensis]
MPDSVLVPVGRVPAYFSTAFGRRPKVLELVREFVSDFHDGVVLGTRYPRRRSSPRGSELSMAAYELMENAMVYGGPDGESSFSIAIDPDPEDPANGYLVRIKTRNRADPYQQQTVCQRLHALSEAEDPLAYYVGLMAATARRPEGSGLGLARVRVEAGMDLSCVVDGDQLEVVAQMRIPHEPGGPG